MDTNKKTQISNAVDDLFNISVLSENIITKNFLTCFIMVSIIVLSKIS